MTRSLVARALGVAAIAACVSAGRHSTLTAAPQEGLSRTLFVSALTKDGAPVTDLTVADFEVKEGGRTQTLTSVKPAATPLRVHVIVSDAGTGAFQAGVLSFSQALIDRSEFAFTSVLVQPSRVMDFTSDGRLVGDGIRKLGRRGSAQGRAQLMDAIDMALKDLAAPGRHPVLVVLRVGNEEPSTVSAASVRDALRRAGATLYVVSRTGASRAAASGVTAGMASDQVARAQASDAEVADTALNLNLVLGDGSRESGGNSQEIALTTTVATLEQLAAEIRSQYEIRYQLPPGTKLSDRVQVSTKRKNLVLHAPQKVAN